VKTILALLAAAPFAFAYGAGNDDLWEVTSQMNMAGMPPGMGGQKHQVCAEKGDIKKAAQPRNDKCKMTDFKQAGNKVTMTMACPDGTATVENTYNAAHTEYNGTVKMTSKRGDMTMTMHGKKIGTCDAAERRAAQNEGVAQMRDSMAAMQSQTQMAMAQSSAQEMANCQDAVDEMKYEKLGMYGRCDQVGDYCKSMLSNPNAKPVATKCMASQAEFCKRYQTMDGFIKAKGDEQAAKMCKVSRDQLIAKSCPQAAQTEHLAFLAHYCPVEAKPVAQAHCVGFDYTSKAKTKYSDFCRTYLSSNDLEGSSKSGSSGSHGTIDPKQAVQQGVQQGINKLKGLFGK
jgi:hypothetical protein